MEALFLKVLNMGLAASWMVLAVLVLRFVLRGTPKRTRDILWALVALRLVCPFSLESAFSLIPSAEPLPQEVLYVAHPRLHTGIPALNAASAPVMESAFAPSPGDSVNPLQVYVYIGAWLWLIGVAAMLLYALVSYWRLRRRTAASIPLQDNVFLNDGIDTPFILGVFAPRVYVPSRLAESPQLPHVLAHERSHLLRHDHWWKPLGFVLLAVYWFNPLLWFAYLLLCRDIELACDERVYRNMSIAERADYAQALLDCGRSRAVAAACPLAFGEVGVRERVKAALHYKKPAFWLLIASALACIVAAVCFLTNPEEKQDLSFLNYENLVSLSAQTDTLIVYTSNGGAYSVDGAALAKYLDQAQWTAQRGMSHSVQRETEKNSTEFTQIAFGETVLKVFNIDTALIVEGVSGSQRYYRTSPGDYEKLRALLETTVDLPEAPPARVWVDHFGEDAAWKDELTLTLPELPYVTFSYTASEIRIDGIFNGSRKSYSIPGMPVWNAFFSDLTRDGIPELCATVSFGSGIVDEHIEVFDAAVWKHYTLWDPGKYDYVLSEAGGELAVSRYEYGRTPPIISAFEAGGDLTESMDEKGGSSPKLHSEKPESTGMLLILGDTLTFARQSQPPAGRFTNLMGFDGYFGSTEVGGYHHTNSYYIANGGEPFQIAESFGFELDDHIVDLDGDGITELVCNCVYGGDGAQRVYVYRRNGTRIERGQIDYDKLSLTAWDDWGVNSVAERFDPDKGKFIIEYASLLSSSGDGTRPGTFVAEAGNDVLTWEEYAQLPESLQKPR